MGWGVDTSAALCVPACMQPCTSYAASMNHCGMCDVHAAHAARECVCVLPLIVLPHPGSLRFCLVWGLVPCGLGPGAVRVACPPPVVAGGPVMYAVPRAGASWGRPWCAAVVASPWARRPATTPCVCTSVQPAAAAAAATGLSPGRFGASPLGFRFWCCGWLRESCGGMMTGGGGVGVAGVCA